MFDEETCVRCTRIAASFPKRSVEQLVTELADDRDPKKASELAAQWNEAEETLVKRDAGEEVAFDEDCSVMKQERAGYRMSAKYGFATVPEFSREFQVEPKACGLKTVSRRTSLGDVEASLVRHLWNTSIRCCKRFYNVVFSPGQELGATCA